MFEINGEAGRCTPAVQCHQTAAKCSDLQCRHVIASRKLFFSRSNLSLETSVIFIYYSLRARQRAQAKCGRMNYETSLAIEPDRISGHSGAGGRNGLMLIGIIQTVLGGPGEAL